MRLTHVRALHGVMGAAIAHTAAVALQGVVMARFLGVAGQGALTLVTTVAALVVVSLTLGTGVSLRLRSRPSPTALDIRAFLGLALAIAPISGLATAGLAAILAPGAVEMSTLVISAVYGAITLAARQAADLVQAYGRTSSSIVSVGVGAVVATMVFGGFVVSHKASLGLALVSCTLGAVTQVGYCLFALRGERMPRSATVDFRRWREFITVGFPSVGYSLGLVAMQRVDRLILIAIAGTTAGGTYAVAATVAESARITSAAVGQLLFVRTAGLHQISHEVRRLYQLALLVQIVSLGVLALAAPLIIERLFGPAYLAAVPLLRGLLVAEFFMGLALMDSRIIMGLGHLGEVGVITGATLVLGIVMYAVLIAGHGAGGAVAASAITYAAYSATLLTRRIRYSRSVEGVDVVG